MIGTIATAVLVICAAGLTIGLDAAVIVADMPWYLKLVGCSAVTGCAAFAAVKFLDDEVTS